MVNMLSLAVRHVTRHIGVGIVCAVAYFDPGNWSVDLQAGSTFGYRPMLFVVLMAGLGAIVLQTLAYKLGCVTGTDLASHCRLLLHDHPRHPKLVRRAVLYPLYVLAEIAILSTDLAEMLGSAIGINLLLPRLPLWAGVILTAVDVLVFLLLSEPTQRRPARTFEAIIIILVMAVFGCFVSLLVKVQPSWPDVFLGYVPSKVLFQSEPNAIYSAVGILGATVMPHAIFLGSFLATQDRVSPPLVLPSSPQKRSLLTRIRTAFTRAEPLKATRNYSEAQSSDRETFIKDHLRHGVVDVVTSLLFIAVPINSAILIVAATIFSHAGEDIPAGLFEAHDLIQDRVGKGAAVLFAVALIFSGQSASITATLAGQLVSEGFIEWSVSPFLRRLITRCLSLIPSVIIAVAVGREGVNTLLVASQVVLSIVLPFVAFPLIWLTSSRIVMRVSLAPCQQHPSLESPRSEGIETSIMNENKSEIPPSPRYIDYSNSRFLTTFSYIIGVIVLAANAYAVVTLITDDDD